MSAQGLLAGLILLFGLVGLAIGWATVRRGEADFSSRTLFRLYCYLASYIGVIITVTGAASLATSLLSLFSLNFVYPSGASSSSTISSILNMSSPSQQQLAQADTVAGITAIIFGLLLWLSHRAMLATIQSEAEATSSRLSTQYAGFLLFTIAFTAIDAIISFFYSLIYAIFFNSSSYVSSHAIGAELGWAIIFGIAALVAIRQYAGLLQHAMKPSHAEPHEDHMKEESSPQEEKGGKK